MKRAKLLKKEKETMDQDLLSDCVEWDVVNWSKALRFWENNLDLNNKNLLCLELGARRGGLSLWLASRGNTVICSDLINPQATAGPIHHKHSLRTKIKYEQIDAQNIPYNDQFDIVVFKSILGGISREGDHQKSKVINEIYKCLKPNGSLLFAENLAASPIHKFFRKTIRPWGSSWNYLNIGEMDSLFTNFDLKYETAGFLGAFGLNEAQKRLLGKMDTFFFEKIMGEKMRYIVYGIATKR